MSYWKVNQIKRRDILLQEMGITEWTLVKTNTLKGVVNLDIQENIRLVIVSEQRVENSHPFIQDICRSLDIFEKDCLIIDFELLPYLQTKHAVIFLCLTDQTDNIRQFKASPVLKEASYYSSSLPRLVSSVQQKRQLWQDIQKIN